MAVNPYMTAGEAILWIATRDAALAAKYADANGIRIALAVRFEGKPACSVRSATKALEAKCREGRIVASGFSGRSSRREQMPPEAWVDIYLCEKGDRMVAAPKPTSAAEHWHDLRFRRVDVVRAFPELGPIQAQVGKAVPAAAPTIKAGTVANQIRGVKSLGVVEAIMTLWAGDLNRAPRIVSQRNQAIIRYMQENGFSKDAVTDKQIKRVIDQLIKGPDVANVR